LGTCSDKDHADTPATSPETSAPTVTNDQRGTVTEFPETAKVEDSSGTLNPARAVLIVDQVAAALDAAHAEQIVHRDVKPGNILLTANDFACLTDFGLANAAQDSKLTTAGSTVGTFAYMAPERLTIGQQVDHLADVYALACVLYECLTGSTPYLTADMTTLIAAHLTAPIPRPSHGRPEVPAAFDKVIERGMAKEREDRYSSAGELAAAARHALGTSPAAPVPVPGPGPVEPPLGRAGRHRTIAVAATAAAVALAAAVAIPLWHGHHHPAPFASAAPPPGAIPPAVAASIPVGKHPVRVALDPAAHRAYTANNGDNTVTVIDTVRRAATGTIKVGSGPIGAVVDPGTRRVWVTNSGSGTVSVTNDHDVLDTIKVGVMPWGIGVDADAHMVYVANNWDNTVTLIDTTSQAVTATVHVGTHPASVAVDPLTHIAYVSNNGDDTVSVIKDRAVVASIKVGAMPWGVAVDPGAHTLYSANYGDRSVSIVDTTRDAVTATINVGDASQAVAVDTSTHIAYVANNATDAMFMLNGNAVTATIHAGDRSWALAVDPDTHTVYSATDRDTMSVIQPAATASQR
ncbi:MAG: serine/threonine-protein kinase, partial [Mycobacterium sp.]|nr:serine/threonine-protein kinase [Mycobacterium sp.]